MAFLDARDTKVLIWFLSQLSGQLRGAEVAPDWVDGMLGTFYRNGLIDSEDILSGQIALDEMILRLRVGRGENIEPS